MQLWPRSPLQVLTDIEREALSNKLSAAAKTVGLVGYLSKGSANGKKK